ncbi:ABC transporter substrate-binding protein [Nitriliruptor alkaliphilus]|uniref:ABC transporter substrate-binding protein n=1 Tax=Nitriliruptor alkaliphilus TaxID=427918 RepID=UPI000697A849|nr:ABC transporter substrate-binding protein [Nitriliruptor alkaliphilus]
MRHATTCALSAFALLLAACSGAEDAATPADASEDAATAPRATDATGTEIELSAPAERIVCLDGACVDALSTLGLEPVGSTQFGMVTNERFYGPETTITQVAGSFFEPYVESVTEAEPDLVLATAGVHADVAAALGDTPVFLQSIADLDAARDYLRAVGDLTGHRDVAEAAIDDFDATLEAYAAASPGDRVAVTMYGSDLNFGIDAADSIIGRTLAEVTPYPWPEAGDNGFLDFSVERLLEVDPDVIFVQTFAFDDSAAPLSEQLADNALWSELTAVRSGAVHEVETDWFATGRSVKTMSLVLDTVMPLLYPEAIPEPLSPWS